MELEVNKSMQEQVQLLARVEIIYHQPTAYREPIYRLRSKTECINLLLLFFPTKKDLMTYKAIKFYIQFNCHAKPVLWFYGLVY